MFALAAALMTALAPMAVGTPPDEARYWNVADELVRRLEPEMVRVDGHVPARMGRRGDDR